MNSEETAPVRFLILGGGCYGTFYARQLLRAERAGAFPVGEIVVIDHAPGCQARRELPAHPSLRFEVAAWAEYLERELSTLSPNTRDLLVTPPFTPHLSLSWLLGRLGELAPGWRWELEPFQLLPTLPFARQGEGGPLVVSHADWMCPVHCIEPSTCPMTRGVRDWDLDRTTRELAEQLAGAGQPVEASYLFHCHHRTFGVGAVPLSEVVGALPDLLSRLDSPAPAERRRFLVATISRCHGALNLLTATRHSS